MSKSSGHARVSSAFAVLCLMSLVAACGSAGPAPTTYVLGTPSPRPDRAVVEPLTGKPVVELKPVVVPDYLDGTDILVRDASSTLAPQPAARWAERLSIGVTRTLAQALTTRLPGFVITTMDPIEPPSRRLLVEIDSFESRSDDSVVLLARWRLLDGSGRKTLAGQRVSLAEPVSRLVAAEIVPAMTKAIEALADRVAEGVRTPWAGARTRRSGPVDSPSAASV